MKLYDDHLKSLGVFPCPQQGDDGYSLKKIRLIYGIDWEKAGKDKAQQQLESEGKL